MNSENCYIFYGFSILWKISMNLAATKDLREFNLAFSLLKIYFILFLREKVSTQEFCLKYFTRGVWLIILL